MMDRWDGSVKKENKREGKNPAGPRRRKEKKKEGEREEGEKKRGGEECGRGKLFSGHAR